jgi:hypothetical protein
MLMKVEYFQPTYRKCGGFTGRQVSDELGSFLDAVPTLND